MNFNPEHVNNNDDNEKIPYEGYDEKLNAWRYGEQTFEEEAEMLEFKEFCEQFAADCDMWEETFGRDCPYDPNDCPRYGGNDNFGRD